MVVYTPIIENDCPNEGTKSSQPLHQWFSYNTISVKSIIFQ